jgi:acyl-CoA synthetase (NDP forming)
LYPDWESLPEVPDIAVFAIPEPLIYDALESAGIYGIRRAIIITAGFGEVGKHAEESRLLSIAKKYNIRLLGPNCLGYGNTSL